MVLHFGKTTGRVSKDDRYVPEKAMARKWHKTDRPTQDDWLTTVSEICYEAADS